jgi:SPP1 family predicted phage head-tail adaptor
MFDRYIHIQQKGTESRTGFGTVTHTGWTDYLDVFATKLPASGSERVQQAQLVSEYSVIFEIRYQEGITTQMRVVENESSVAYDIQRVEEVGRKDKIRIYAKNRDNE